MEINIFSFIMSLVYFNLFVIIIHLLKKNNTFIIKFNTFTFSFMVILSFIRLIFPFDLANINLTRVIGSKHLYTTIHNFFNFEINFNGKLKIINLFIIIWLIGLAFFLVKSVFDYKNLKYALNHINKVNNLNHIKIFDDLINKKYKNLKNKVCLIESKNIKYPMVSGVRTCNIYIPELEYSNKELTYILQHELNHFLRKDTLKKLILHFSSIIFWWNPLFKVLNYDFHQIIEIKCDLAVTSNLPMSDKKLYLQNIINIIKYSQNKNMKSNGNLFSYFIQDNDTSNIKQRMQIVLENKKNHQYYSFVNIGFLLSCIFVFILSYMLIIQPVFEPPIQDDLYTDDIIYIKKDDGSIVKYKDMEVY
ncbi:MAG: M56 family metallopeptidase [Peptoniphilaceae bacterium]